MCRLSFQILEVPKESEYGDSLPEVLTKDKTDSTGPLHSYVIANNNAEIGNTRPQSTIAPSIEGKRSGVDNHAYSDIVGRY